MLSLLANANMTELMTAQNIAQKTTGKANSNISIHLNFAILTDLSV